jgi:hypothetical protein
LRMRSPLCCRAYTLFSRLLSQGNNTFATFIIPPELLTVLTYDLADCFEHCQEAYRVFDPCPCTGRGLIAFANTFRCTANMLTILNRYVAFG